MKNVLINLIKAKMEPHLTEIQISELNRNLKVILRDFEVVKINESDESKENHELLLSFLSAKEIEGAPKEPLFIIKIQFLKCLINSI